jgi:hypothetical protein
MLIKKVANLESAAKHGPKIKNKHSLKELEETEKWNFSPRRIKKTKPGKVSRLEKDRFSF